MCERTQQWEVTQQLRVPMLTQQLGNGFWGMNSSGIPEQGKISDSSGKVLSGREWLVSVQGPALSAYSA